MNEKILALAVMAKDEASATLAKIESHLGQLAQKADVAGRAMGGLGNVLRGIGQGIGISVFFDLQNAISRLIGLFPDLISKGQQYGSLVDDIADRTGATAQEASKLAATLQFLGVNTDGLGLVLGRLSASVKGNESEFRKLGIATRDGNGNWLTSVQILDNLRSRMQGANLDAASQATLTKVLGRGWGQFADYLGLSDAQIKLVTEDAASMGLVLDEKARRAAEDFGRETKRLDGALTGLGQTIFTTLAPALINFVDGMGNFIRQNAQQIADFVSQVASFIFGLIGSLTGITPAFSSFTAQLGAVAPAATDAGSALGDAFGATTKAKVDKQTAAIDAHIRAITNDERALDKQIRAIVAQERGIEASVRAIDKEERALSRETQTLDKQIQALNDKQAAQHKVSDAAIAGLDKELAKRLALLDAEDKARHQTETHAQLAQELADAQREQAIALQGDAKGVVDPNAVHSANERVQSILAAMGDEAYSEAQDKRRADVTAEADAAKAKIQSAQDARDAVIDAEIAKANAAKAAIDAEKQGLEDQKQRYADQKQALDDVKQRYEDQKQVLDDLKHRYEDQKAAIDKATGAAKTFGLAVKGASAEATLGVAELTSGIAGEGAGAGASGTSSPSASSTSGSLVAAMDRAKKAGEEMGKKIREAFDTVKSALKTVGDAIDTISKGFAALNSALDAATGGDQIAKTFIVIAGFAALTGNFPLAIAFLAAAGIKVAVEQQGSVDSSLKGQANQSGAGIGVQGGGGLPGAPVDYGPSGPNSAGVAYGQALAMGFAQSTIAELQKLPPAGRYSHHPNETNAQALARLKAELAAGKFSDGGYASGGWAGLHGPELAWLGERGPELVIPNDRLGSMGRGERQRVEIPISINGREVARAIVDDIDALLFGQSRIYQPSLPGSGF